MPNDYYIVLGIERGADMAQIKRAYRRAVKRYHPDTIDSGADTAKFQEAYRAYEVLSDKDKRRAYDATLEGQGIPVRVAVSEEYVHPRTETFEKLTTPLSMIDDFFEGFVPGFYGKRQLPKDLYLEIVLTPEEASRGGVFPVTVPVLEPCATCGSGGRWRHPFFCPDCRGRGTVQTPRQFKLVIPPNTQHGTRVAVSLTPLGLGDASLVVDVCVENHFVW